MYGRCSSNGHGVPCGTQSADIRLSAEFAMDGAFQSAVDPTWDTVAVAQSSEVIDEVEADIGIAGTDRHRRILWICSASVLRLYAIEDGSRRLLKCIDFPADIIRVSECVFKQQFLLAVALDDCQIVFVSPHRKIVDLKPIRCPSPVTAFAFGDLRQVCHASNVNRASCF